MGQPGIEPGLDWGMDHFASHCTITPEKQLGGETLRARRVVNMDDTPELQKLSYVCPASSGLVPTQEEEEAPALLWAAALPPRAAWPELLPRVQVQPWRAVERRPWVPPLVVRPL